MSLDLRSSGMVEEWEKFITGIISQRFLLHFWIFRQVKCENSRFSFSISSSSLGFWVVVTSHRTRTGNKVQEFQVFQGMLHISTETNWEKRSTTAWLRWRKVPALPRDFYSSKPTQESPEEMEMLIPNIFCRQI